MLAQDDKAFLAIGLDPVAFLLAAKTFTTEDTEGTEVRLVWICFLIGGLGCTRRPAAVRLPDMEIPVRCVSDVRMVGCDARVSPPKCRSARVTYRNGCEEIVVGEKR
jgi:hypothetical protein